MARDERPLTEQTDANVQDEYLVQAVHQSLRMARNHSGDRWSELEVSCERLLDRLGAGSSRSEEAEKSMDRIDRGSLHADQDTTERAVASLMALSDHPNDRQLRIALDCLADLEEALGRS